MDGWVVSRECFISVAMLGCVRMLFVQSLLQCPLVVL